jgi:hypothetical protein
MRRAGQRPNPGKLRDLQTPIEIAFQGSFKVECQQQRQIALSQTLAQFLIQHSLTLKRRKFFLDLLFETPGHRCTHAMPADRCILLVDARRYGECQAKYSISSGMLIGHDTTIYSISAVIGLLYHKRNILPAMSKKTHMNIPFGRTPRRKN